MKILFCGLKNEYGNPARGPSFEYKHFYTCLTRMEGVEASMFPFDEIMQKDGRDAMNAQLIRTVEEQKPDLLFCFLFTEEIKKETIRHITEKTKTKTFNWFGDDHWRMPGYSRYWAPQFTLVSTTDSKALKHYQFYGITNVIKTQWAANPFVYVPQNPQKNPGSYGVTFFGQMYGSRGAYVEFLKKNGLPAVGHGRGWPVGGGSEIQQMLDIYSYSKINLNFSETPYYGVKNKLNLLAKLFVKKELGKYHLNFQSPITNIQSLLGTQRLTIKARVFEVSACGGFLLTGKSDEPLGEYFDLGKEVVEFSGKDDLLEKCRYYLAHDREREQIAKQGYERTIKEHTYPHRFREIFKTLEL